MPIMTQIQCFVAEIHIWLVQDLSYVPVYAWNVLEMNTCFSVTVHDPVAIIMITDKAHYSSPCPSAYA